MPAKTKEQFILEAKAQHGDRYNYKDVNYINNKTKIQIICSIHGPFWQSPKDHLRGSNCPSCAGNKQKTKDQFVKEANLIHKEKYDYSQSDYKNRNLSIIIICKIHGPFNKIPKEHLKGSGCSLCIVRKPTYGISKTQSEFISEASNKHNDKYDYSLVNYINIDTKVSIICPVHGQFEQTPYHHLKGQGCAKCAGNVKKELQSFIKEANLKHNNLYDYSKSEYNSAHTKLIIICRIHGSFDTTPNRHLQGHGCNKCNKGVRSSQEQFIDEASKIHDNFYDYSDVEYSNCDEKVIVKCPIHGQFRVTPDKHLHRRSGCPSCVNKTEGKFKNYLDVLKVNYIQQYQIMWCKNIETGKFYRYDYYLPDHNLIIEIDGPQHYQQVSIWKSPLEQQKIDRYKERCAIKHGIAVYRFLQEDIWNDRKDWQQKIKGILDARKTKKCGTIILWTFDLDEISEYYGTDI